jgi:manganese oxidase
VGRRGWIGLAAAGGAVAVIVGVGIAAGPGGGEHDMGSMDGMAMDATPSPMSEGSMGGHDMSAVDTTGAEAPPADAVGGRPLEAMPMGGETMYSLTAAPVSWPITEDVRVGAMAYNGQVPGPAIRARVGDRLRIEVTNRLTEPTSVHWHGLDVPNAMDGAGGVTQPNIAPGETFVYRFRVTRAGTFFYHSHTAADRQMPLGLSGALIVGGRADESVAADVPMMLGEWTIGSDGSNIPSMELEGALPNWFTINGKSYPDTARIRVRRGQKVRIRFIGSGQFAHPMHIHGGPFRIVATDGNPVPRAAQLTKDTVLVAPGERYDVIWTARRTGTWLVHCHILHHTTNDGGEVDGGGGLTTAIEVA